MYIHTNLFFYEQVLTNTLQQNKVEDSNLSLQQMFTKLALYISKLATGILAIFSAGLREKKSFMCVTSFSDPTWGKSNYIIVEQTPALSQHFRQSHTKEDN